MTHRIKIIRDKVIRHTLRFLTGFDKWHVSPLGERPYAIDIINYCNSQDNRDYFAEIGCGLGDIVRNVRYINRVGYDMDKKVLIAARMFPVKGGKKKNVVFKEFHFPDSQLIGKLNVLVLVNWIHHIEPVPLGNKIKQYFNDNISPNGCLIIDTVQDPAYRYNHSIEFLTNKLNCSVSLIGSYARQREVWVIKKIK